MKNFIKKITIIWTLIFIAFWLGSGMKNMQLWSDDWMGIFAIILVLTMIPPAISTDRH